MNSPMIPQIKSSRIGFVFLYLVRKKAARKSITLKINVTGFSVGDPKFSLFIRSTAAAAIKPMMAGRRPAKMSFTIFESLWVIR